MVVAPPPVLVLLWFPSDFVVEREERFGGNVSFQRYEDLEQAYVEQVQRELCIDGLLCINLLMSLPSPPLPSPPPPHLLQTVYPLDLKNSVAKYLNQLLDPIRRKFESSSELQQLRRDAYPQDEGQSWGFPCNWPW